MKRYKIYLISALVVLVFLIVGIIIKINNNRCDCVKFKKFTELTIYPNSTFDSREDSICVVSGNRNGDLVIKRFN